MVNKKIFIKLNRILRCLKKLDFLHFFAVTVLAVLSILSVYSIILVITTKLMSLEFNLGDEQAFRTFFFSFKDYKFLYGTTLGIYSLYWSIKTFKSSKEDYLLKDEFDVCSYYANEAMPLVSKLILELQKYKLFYTGDCSNKSFYSDELQEKNDDLFQLTFEILSNNKDIIKLNIEALTCLEYFSYRVLHSRFQGEIAFEIYALAFTSQVSALYPVIAVTRSDEQIRNHFNSIIVLYKKWNLKINSAKLHKH